MVFCVLPSAIWRTLVGFGVDLGWSPEQLAMERIPGPGTRYVLSLSVLSIATAALSLGLVQEWGDRFPRWLPLIGGRRLPTLLVCGVAVLGAGVLGVLCVLGVLHWDQVSGFADRPDSSQARLMLACYLPLLAWPVLLIATTWAYYRRRRNPAREADHGEPTRV